MYSNFYIFLFFCCFFILRARSFSSHLRCSAGLNFLTRSSSARLASAFFLANSSARSAAALLENSLTNSWRFLLILSLIYHLHKVRKTYTQIPCQLGILASLVSLNWLITSGASQASSTKGSNSGDSDIKKDKEIVRCLSDWYLHNIVLSMIEIYHSCSAYISGSTEGKLEIIKDSKRSEHFSMTWPIFEFKSKSANFCVSE